MKHLNLPGKTCLREGRCKGHVKAMKVEAMRVQAMKVFYTLMSLMKLKSIKFHDNVRILWNSDFRVHNWDAEGAHSHSPSSVFLVIIILTSVEYVTVSVKLKILMIYPLADKSFPSPLRIPSWGCRLHIHLELSLRKRSLYLLGASCPQAPIAEIQGCKEKGRSVGDSKRYSKMNLSNALGPKFLNIVV